MKRRKVGPGRPRQMCEFLTPSASASTRSGSSQASTMSRRRQSPSPPPPPPQPLQALPESVQHQAVRGHNKGVPEWNTGVKVQVTFDGLNQPVGDKGSLLRSQLGIICRDGHRIPLTILDWKYVEDSVKEGIWAEVKANVLEVPNGFRDVCIRLCNHMWKDYKAKTKKKYFEKFKNDPELHKRVPPRIVPEQWPVLVAYWRNADAEAIAKQNGINREQQGPHHITGRKSFAQIRHEMEKNGEPMDKMSVWLKARNPNDPDVVETIKDYKKELSKEPEDQQQLMVVKDRIFHKVIGLDGHGYCRTFGSSAPPSMVYPLDPPTHNNNSEQMQKMREELRVEVTEDVTRKVTEDVTAKLTKQFEMQYEEMKKLFMHSEGNEGRSSHSLTQIATSAHRKESIGDGDHLVASENEPINENEAADEEFVQVEDV